MRIFQNRLADQRRRIIAQHRLEGRAGVQKNTVPVYFADEIQRVIGDLAQPLFAGAQGLLRLALGGNVLHRAVNEVDACVIFSPDRAGSIARPQPAAILRANAKFRREGFTLASTAWRLLKSGRSSG